MQLTTTTRIKDWLISPIIFVAFLSFLLLIWAVLTPQTLVHYFDNNGRSFFELITLPFYAFIIPLVWWKCPFEGTLRRKRILQCMVSVVVVMAIIKQLDIHNAALHCIYPSYVGEDGYLLPGLVKPNGQNLIGTPFKMRVITNGGVPFGMKSLIVFYFLAFFGVFSAGFLCLLPSWIKGVFSYDPAAWAIGCFGLSGVVVQISDRLPAWIREATGEWMAAEDGSINNARSLCTALEEGGEMMIALFAILAIFFAYKSIKKTELKNV